MDRPYPCVTVTEKAARSLRDGHPWVFAEEIAWADPACTDGDPVDVRSGKGRWLGTGFYNSHSKIRVRVLTQNANDRIDAPFFARRLRYAVDCRRAVMGDDFACCRLVFGEADGLPGLTVDRFGDVLVSEVLCLGIEQRKQTLYRLLTDLLAERGVTVRAIYERSDAPIRQKEGLDAVWGYVALDGLEPDGTGHVLIRENGLLYDVDYAAGQKTGFFLDQKYNRQAAARLARDRNVLDCFTHTGAFALNAAAAGAKSVTAVDVSAQAINAARQNAALNGLQNRVRFVQADVFELLTRLDEQHCRDYDYIILDPPAFTKSSATIQAAYRGYREINRRAMHLLPRGGFLATCSCSHFMSEELFCRMLRQAAGDASVSLRQLEARQQAPDHPIAWGIPETAYLKFYLFQIV